MCVCGGGVVLEAAAAEAVIAVPADDELTVCAMMLLSDVCRREWVDMRTWALNSIIEHVPSSNNPTGTNFQQVPISNLQLPTSSLQTQESRFLIRSVNVRRS